jgi:hypothetical protein
MANCALNAWLNVELDTVWVEQLACCHRAVMRTVTTAGCVCMSRMIYSWWEMQEVVM